MREFLGKYLQAAMPDEDNENEVEVNGQTVKVVGPLSDAFTEALNEELKKDRDNGDDDPVPVLESFTDPAMVAQYIVQRINNQSTKANPLVLYTFDRNHLDEKVIVDAAKQMATGKREIIVVMDYTGDKAVSSSDRTQSPGEYKYLESALESIVEALGGTVVHTGTQLTTAIESFYSDEEE